MRDTGWSKRREGAIEGLPLYLLIIIIITAVSLGIVMGLLNLVRPPQALGAISISPGLMVVSDADGDGRYTNDSFEVTVVVTDSSGNRLAGAVVSLSGCGVKTASGTNPYTTTSSDGRAAFSALRCEVLGPSQNPLIVTVEKSGFGRKTLDIPVVRA